MLIQQIYAHLWGGQHCSFFPPMCPHGQIRAQDTIHLLSTYLCDSMIRQNSSKSTKTLAQIVPNLSISDLLSHLLAKLRKTPQTHFSHISNTLFSSQDCEPLSAASSCPAENRPVTHGRSPSSHWRWEAGRFWQTIPNSLFNFVSQFFYAYWSHDITSFSINLLPGQCPAKIWSGVYLSKHSSFTWTMFYMQWSVTSRTFPPDIIQPLSLNIGEASGMLKQGAVTFKGYGIWYAGLFMHPLAMHSFRFFSYPPPTLILVQSKRF